MKKTELSPEQKIDYVLIFLSFASIITFLFNNLLINYNFSKMIWTYIKMIPVETPFGLDYRDGWYLPAQQILHGGNVSSISQYPPLVSVLAIPLAWIFSEQTGYFIQVGILCILTLASLFLSLKVALEVFPLGLNHDRVKTIIYVLFLVFAFYHFTSYGFAFSIERGNYDIYAIFFSLLSIWCLVKKPEQIWLQVLFLSIAIHLKLYPAILILPLIWKHKWKIILPTIVLNLALFFILGPAEAVGFVQKITTTIQSPPMTTVNHSTTAFITFLMDNLNGSGTQLSWAMRWVIRLLPILIYLGECLWLLPGGYTREKAVWLFICSVPLMNMIPEVSYDYKTVILTAPMLITTYLLIRGLIKGDFVKPFILLVLLSVAAFFLARSFVVTSDLFRNKWPFIFLLQAVIAGMLVFYNPYKLKDVLTYPAILLRRRRSPDGTI
jgi:hypothetical protein